MPGLSACETSATRLASRSSSSSGEAERRRPGVVYSLAVLTTRCPSATSSWHERPTQGWDWWSEAKLQVLTDYLQGFTRAVRGKSSKANYLDLFAGSYENDQRYGPGTFPGSAQVALNTQPEFTKLAFFELAGPAQRLRTDIAAARPHDRRWQV